MNQTADSNSQTVQNEVIDLRELFSVLKRRKKLIWSITTLITLLAVAYALVKTPMYEARALIEIGNYKSVKNNSVLLDETSQLSKKLHILFIDVFKNTKDKESVITSISVPKGQTSFLEVKALAISNEKAKEEIQKLLTYTQAKHQKILDDVKWRRELEIRNIEIKINDIKTKEVKLINKKIALTKDTIAASKKELLALEESLKNMKNANSAFIALQLIQKRDLVQNIERLENKLIDIQNKKNTLESTTINKLLEDKALISSMLLPYNYKNTEIIGEIITNDHPVKPKKTLIIIVAFITGLMLSIFLAFFLEFLRGMKEEEKDA